MANPDIGKIVCPSCDFPDASVREAKSRKCYVVCEECGYQGFTRDQKSDGHIRRKMRPVGPVETPPAGPVSKVVPEVKKGFGTLLG